jgi:hypothetical protein
VDATNEIERNAVAAVTDRVVKNVNVGIFCNEVMKSGKLNTVPFLLLPISIGAIGAICNTENEPTFKTVFIRRYERQPSSMPSASPSEQPTHSPTPVKPHLITIGFLGFLSIICLIGCLRIYPAIFTFFAVMKTVCHKYDILLMIDNDEVIIENINHDDIVYFRRTCIEEDYHKLNWVINANRDVLEKRFEVKFFDHYDLLNAEGMMDTDNWKTRDSSNGDASLYKAKMHTGMIIRVKPQGIKDTKDVQGSRKYGTKFFDESNSSRTNFENMSFVESLTGRVRGAHPAPSEESESEILEHQSPDVSVLSPKAVPRSLIRRRSLDQKVHWDTYVPHGESLTMPMIYVPHGDSLTMPRMARGRNYDHIPRPPTLDGSESSYAKITRTRSLDRIPQLLSLDISESSYARRIRRRSYDHIPRPNLLCLPPFEDTRKANPCEPVGQMIGTHQRSIEGDVCMEKILMSVNCLSTDVPSDLPDSISANEGLHTSKTFGLNRQSIMNVLNLLPPLSSVDVADDESQLHSTGTFITIIIEFAFFYLFYDFLLIAIRGRVCMFYVY